MGYRVPLNHNDLVYVFHNNTNLGLGRIITRIQNFNIVELLSTGLRLALYRFEIKKQNHIIENQFNPKIACPKGHYYTKKNTYINRKGNRICRMCHREKQYLRYHNQIRTILQ